MPSLIKCKTSQKRIVECIRGHCGSAKTEYRLVMDHFVRIMRPILQQHGAQVFDQAIRVIEVRDTFIKEDDRANARVAKLKIDESPKGREMEARFYDALEVIYFRVKGQLKQEVAKDVDMSAITARVPVEYLMNREDSYDPTVEPRRVFVEGELYRP